MAVEQTLDGAQELYERPSNQMRLDILLLLEDSMLSVGGADSDRQNVIGTPEIIGGAAGGSPPIIYPNHPSGGYHNSPADSLLDNRADSPKTIHLTPITSTRAIRSRPGGVHECKELRWGFCE